MSEIHYPFSAVVGQPSFKLALVLAAINPRIGGVVIGGPRGSAKSTLARGMADLLPTHPPCEDDDASASLPAEFVTLPLGASEEMLLGTLDLQQVLQDKTVAFNPGLLSRAHGGVLYVDEVNLLPDNLVDLLLDVAASGVNRVERDGISHSHKAEFLLVGTMNPDEGELRPQLHDRFGLSVQLSNQYAAAERVEIVRQREAFEADPEGFCRRYQPQQQQLIEQIQAARTLLPKVGCEDELRLAIAERCAQAQVDGLRADLVWFRAACAHAAWQGREQVERQDLDAVEELVLAHRRRAQVSPPPSPQPNQPPPPSGPQGGGFKRPDTSRRDPETEAAGDWGAMSPQAQQRQAISGMALDHLSPEANFTGTAVAGLTDRAGKRRGDQADGRHQGAELSNRPDWFATLVQQLGQWPPKALRWKKAQQGQAALHLVLLDTSASTLAQQQFGRAKAVLGQIAERAYLEREQLAVFGFGNNRVDNLLPRVRAPKELDHWLDQLEAGGGTPLYPALQQAQQYLSQLQRRSPGLQLCSYILTDGRSRAELQSLQLPGKTVWIDTEAGAVKRGRGRRLAQQLGADYWSLEQLTSPAG
ncbi:VWA domain-containing protein [Motiliproteus coralliicola]|uniref:VWA domain-containing protein n=1 Tax=Motiliproteus coralliicola TaxID=2283196 RepID=A0A369WFK8_9GAMM|nr:ATP-binding protein [Motiliproteus coralliicola]RDE18255.1 VWA domain-containing protein [Motiliproteus coralliicola]